MESIKEKMEEANVFMGLFISVLGKEACPELVKREKLMNKYLEAFKKKTLTPNELALIYSDLKKWALKQNNWPGLIAFFKMK